MSLLDSTLRGRCALVFRRSPCAAAQFVLIFDQVNNQLGFADADSSLCPATNAVDGAQGPSEAFAPVTALAPITVRGAATACCSMMVQSTRTRGHSAI